MLDPGGRSPGGFGVLWVYLWPGIVCLAAFGACRAHSGAKPMKMSLKGSRTLQRVPVYIKQARFRRMWCFLPGSGRRCVVCLKNGSCRVESHTIHTNTCIKHNCHDIFHLHNKMSSKGHFVRNVRWSRGGRVTVTAVAV